MNIYLLMSTYNKKYSSGGTIAHRTAEYLAKKASVTVITIGEKRETLQENGIKVESFPLGMNYHKALLFTRAGIQEDYLSNWCKIVLEFIRKEIKPGKEDVFLATTVGELGMLHVGNAVKNMYGSKFYIHFHDPIKHAKVNGLKYGQYPLPYASREKYENEYVNNADKIFTCCDSFKEYLIKKYPGIEGKVQNYYFGWNSNLDTEMTESIHSYQKPFKVVYGGIFNWPQGPEILGKSLGGLKGFEVEYIGVWDRYKPVLKQNANNIKCIKRMDKAEYVKYLSTEVDMGFVPLSRDYFSACVPAKLYEYINAGIPILATLPEGDARNIINDNGYGIAVGYNVEELRRVALSLTKERLEEYKLNILKDREKWRFDNCMTGFFKEIVG